VLSFVHTDLVFIRQHLLFLQCTGYFIASYILLFRARERRGCLLTDFVSKVITIIMCFVMLVVAPILMVFATENGTSRLLVLNEITAFLDKVSDKGTISPTDLDQIYNDLNSHGMVLDVDVNRMMRVAFTEASSTGAGGTINEAYIKIEEANGSEDINLNTKDVIQVHVYEVVDNPVRKLLYNFLRIDNGALDVTLAKTVG